MNGKAIYQPKPAAAEYAKFICQFYYGCTCGCEYCCNKRWKWGPPKLKTCFKDEEHALQVFDKELQANLPELQKHGLFFCISTDPMLKETITISLNATKICINNDVPVKILTKNAKWVNEWVEFINSKDISSFFFRKMSKKYIAFGFTLTGHDSKEPNVSTNAERIEAIRKLHKAGFKTWASIEPVISIPESINMVQLTRDFCDLYKVGLLSGKRYDRDNLNYLIQKINHYSERGINAKIYFKDELLKQAGINRKDLPSNCVSRDYNMFEIK